MFKLFGEGIESLRLPCSWPVLLIGTGLALLGRRRPVATTVAFVTTAGLVAFLRFGGWWVETPQGATQVIVGLALGMAAWGAWRVDRLAGDVALSAFVGAVAVSTWIPCVGPHLGELLNTARVDPWSQLPGTIAFMVGLTIPFAIVTALAATAPPSLVPALRDRRVVAAGMVVLVLVSATMAITVFDDLSSELARRSTF